MWKKGGWGRVASDGALVSRASRVLNDAVMIISCPACSTRYVVPDSAIGVDGRTVRCAKCRHSWFQEGPEIELVAPAAARSDVAPPPEPSPPEPVAVPEPPSRAEEAVGETVEQEPAEDSYSAAPALNSQVDTSSSSLVYDDALARFDEDEGPSSFEHAPPFRRRRNWGRIWMAAGIAFALVALAAVAGLARFGLPDWLRTTTAGTFAPVQPELVIDFPPNRQDRRTLPNGSEFFGASGKITNVGKTTHYVPSILIVLRDARGRIVYSWEVVPPKRELAPGEAITINEAVTDVPKSAVAAEIGWKPD